MKKKHHSENIIEHIGEISKGDTFGAWYILFESNLRQISAEATENSEVVFIPNDLLKQKRKKRQAMEQQQAQANIQAQADANAQTAERAAMAEVQKQQALADQNLNYEKSKSQFDIQKMQTASQIKQQEMQVQFEYDKKLKEMEVDQIITREKYIEDRKDNRTKLEGTQQSKMIDQRKFDLLPTNFQQNK